MWALETSVRHLLQGHIPNPSHTVLPTGVENIKILALMGPFSFELPQDQSCVDQSVSTQSPGSTLAAIAAREHSERPRKGCLTFGL